MTLLRRSGAPRPHQ